MKAYRIKKRGDRPETYVTAIWPNTVDDKRKTLTYFLRGQGYKKTKAFEMVDIDVTPEKDAMYLGNIYNTYGADIAAELCQEAFCCCRLSAEAWCEAWGAFLTKASQHLSQEEIASVPHIIKDSLRPVFGAVPVIDIDFMDKALSKEDPEYDSDTCTYRGTEMSMQGYVTAKFGTTAARFIKALI